MHLIINLKPPPHFTIYAKPNSLLSTNAQYMRNLCLRQYIFFTLISGKRVETSQYNGVTMIVRELHNEQTDVYARVAQAL